MSPDLPPLGLYVHWPYCVRICPYCDFNVYRARGASAQSLSDALLTDLAHWRTRTGPRKLVSLHFGGGTPSLMPAREIARLIETADRLWGFVDEAEIGLEANPQERARLADIAAAGVNRVSVGVQALSDADLKALGRDHDAEGGLDAIARARALFAHVSADLIYAREGQSLEGWEQELSRMLALEPDHLSLYQLTIEPGTAFGRRAERGGLIAPTEDLAADMYTLTQALTAAAGLEAYEISNHARRPEDRSVHNQLYWTGGDWIGVGPGAHSRVGTAQQDGRLAGEALMRPDAYIDGVSRGSGQTFSLLSPLEEAQERVLMGVRILEGLDRAQLRAATGLDIDPDAARQLETQGLISLTQDRVRLTPAGRLYGDRIAIELAPDSA